MNVQPQKYHRPTQRVLEKRSNRLLSEWCQAYHGDRSTLYGHRLDDLRPRQSDLAAHLADNAAQWSTQSRLSWHQNDRHFDRLNKAKKVVAHPLR